DSMETYSAHGRRVSFGEPIDEIASVSSAEHSHRDPAPIRSILKNHNVTNLLKIANDKMLRELEQCVEERDRLRACIAGADVSNLLPRTKSAQTRYRDHMIEQLSAVSELIEDKYGLLRQTLCEDSMPAWLRDKENAASSITLVGHNT
ncbi:hypothetical protein PENTCL1PPCAC_14019, partial [Pristionchus entomophagus]